MSTDYIEIYGNDAEHYAFIWNGGRASSDEPLYDATDPDNQPETLAEYAARMQAEYGNAPVYFGPKPYAVPASDPDTPIAKYREQVGAVLGHFLEYPGRVTERVSKAQYERTHVPERETNGSK